MLPFWLVGEFTTQFRTCFSGGIESDVRRGYDLDLDPWPNAETMHGLRSASRRSGGAAKLGAPVGATRMVKAYHQHTPGHNTATDQPSRRQHKFHWQAATNVSARTSVGGKPPKFASDSKSSRLTASLQELDPRDQDQSLHSNLGAPVRVCPKMGDPSKRLASF